MLCYLIHVCNNCHYLYLIKIMQEKGSRQEPIKAPSRSQPSPTNKETAIQTKDSRKAPASNPFLLLPIPHHHPQPPPNNFASPTSASAPAKATASNKTSKPRPSSPSSKSTCKKSVIQNSIHHAKENLTRNQSLKEAPQQQGEQHVDSLLIVNVG